MNQSDIEAAAERLRTRSYGECDEDMHQHAEDCKILAHAYLALGKRQPDETRILADGRLWDVTGSPEDALAQMLCDGYDDAKLVTTAVFVKEVQGDS